MTPERWQRVRDVFHQARPLPIDARQPFIDRACAGDGALLDEVASLLQADRGDGFLEVPAIANAAIEAVEDWGTAADPPPPARVGPYRIDRLIGRGGMGDVYLACREGDFIRRVALKIVKRGMDTVAIVRRFRNERQILAHFDHPAIASLLDGGTTDDGVPYLVMEYIDGRPITDHCDVHGLDVGARIELVLSVCGAIQYAHQSLVVHRDLKPSNILIAPDGQPKLLDFGIAKILQPDSSYEPVEPTLTAMRVLTPEYASPEQCRGETITTVSDVYALGVLLFVLLTGRRPYDVKTGTPEEIVRAVCEQDAERPSAAAPKDSPLAADLDADLDAIVLKALEKDPARRYQSAQALADDLQRHRDGSPVTARPISHARRLGKFIRRHRVGATVAVTALLSLSGGLTAAVWQGRVASAERARADVERDRAEQRFNDVRQLAGSLLFDFNDAIDGLDGALAARQLVVKRGLEYLERLARDAGDDPVFRLELARGYSRMGQIRGDYFGNSNLGDFHGALDSFRAGRQLLEKPEPWPEATRWERGSVLAEIHAYAAEARGVTGDTRAGLREIGDAVRWHEYAMRAYAAAHDGARASNAQMLRQLYLSEADLLVMTGDLAATFETMQAMRRAIEDSFTAPESDTPWGTYHARMGAAQHILAVSMKSRLGDAAAERALLAEALEHQRRGYEFRQRVWQRDPQNAGVRTLPGQCLLFMGNLAFSLGRDAEGDRWIEEGIRLNESTQGYGPGAWGHHWRARRFIRHGRGAEALPQLARAKAMHELESSIQPDGALTRNRLAAVFEDQGEAHWLTGDRGSAEQAFRIALDMREKLVTSAPTNGEFAGSLVSLIALFGGRLVESGKDEDARAETRRVMQILRSQADSVDATASRLTEYAWLLLTARPPDLRDAATALAYARRALDMPHGVHPDSLAVLAVAEQMTGDAEAAVATALRVYDLVPVMRAGRTDEQLRLDVHEQLSRHRLEPLARPLWF